MTNLPKTVQWVLAFLNINSTPGKPDLYRLPYELRKLKREPRPKEITNLTIKNNELIDKITGYQYQNRNNKPKNQVNIFKLERQLEETRTKLRKLLEAHPELKEYMVKKREIVPKQSNLEIIKNLDLKKDIKFKGINNAPTLKDYKKFFLEKGIPPCKGKDLLLQNGKPLSSLNIKSYNNRPKNNSEDGFYDYYQDNPRIEYIFCKEVGNVHSELFRILSNMVHGTNTYVEERSGSEGLYSYMRQIINLYLECWKMNEVPAESGRTSWGVPYRGRHEMVSDSMSNKEPFPHYGMIPHALYACILDFGINHKELHQYLRQCLYCGRFWIPEKRCGRPNICYCSTICERKANAPTRYDDLMNKRLKRTKKRNNDKPKILNHLMGLGYRQGEAENIYNKIPKRITANYDYFIKKWAEPRGYT